MSATTLETEAPERRQFTVFGAAKSYSAGSKHVVAVPDSLRLMKDREEIPTDHFVFRVCTPEGGDERIAWNPYRIQEVAEARRLFNDLIKKGYYAYKIDENTGGRGGEIVRRFEDIIGEGEVMMSEIRPAIPQKQTVGAEIVMHPRPVAG